MYQIRPQAISLFRSWFAISEQPTEFGQILPQGVRYYGSKLELRCFPAIVFSCFELQTEGSCAGNNSSSILVPFLLS